jgi:hypothetical protein
MSKLKRFYTYLGQSKVIAACCFVHESISAKSSYYAIVDGGFCSLGAVALASSIPAEYAPLISIVWIGGIAHKLFKILYPYT